MNDIHKKQRITTDNDKITFDVMVASETVCPLFRVEVYSSFMYLKTFFTIILTLSKEFGIEQTKSSLTAMIPLTYDIRSMRIDWLQHFLNSVSIEYSFVDNEYVLFNHFNATTKFYKRHTIFINRYVKFRGMSMSFHGLDNSKYDTILSVDAFNAKMCHVYPSEAQCITVSASPQTIYILPPRVRLLKILFWLWNFTQPDVKFQASLGIICIRMSFILTNDEFNDPTMFLNELTSVCDVFELNHVIFSKGTDLSTLCIAMRPDFSTACVHYIEFC